MSKVVYKATWGVSGASVAAVLAALKVAGVLNISWFWVTVPIWLPFALFLSFLAAMAVGVLFMAILAAILDRR